MWASDWAPNMPLFVLLQTPSLCETHSANVTHERLFAGVDKQMASESILSVKLQGTMWTLNFSDSGVNHFMPTKVVAACERVTTKLADVWLNSSMRVDVSLVAP